MSKPVPFVLLSLMLATTAGCSYRHMQEFDARLESAENNAASARLKADEALNKAQLASELASQAQRTADEANERTARMATKVPRR